MVCEARGRARKVRRATQAKIEPCVCCGAPIPRERRRRNAEVRVRAPHGTKTAEAEQRRVERLGGNSRCALGTSLACQQPDIFFDSEAGSAKKTVFVRDKIGFFLAFVPQMRRGSI